jgi:hypothetical protein
VVTTAVPLDAVVGAWVVVWTLLDVDADVSVEVAAVLVDAVVVDLPAYDAAAT